MSYTIRIVGNYSGDIILGGKTLIRRNAIIIRGDTDVPSNHIIDGLIDITTCHADINFNGTIGTILRYIQATNSIRAGGSSGVHILNCEPRRAGQTAMLIRSSFAVVDNCDFGEEFVRDCILAQNSQVFSINNTGRGTRYGLWARDAASIGKHGTQPTGVTEDEFVERGGVIR